MDELAPSNPPQLVRRFIYRPYERRTGPSFVVAIFDLGEDKGGRHRIRYTIRKNVPTTSDVKAIDLFDGEFWTRYAIDTHAAVLEVLGSLQYIRRSWGWEQIVFYREDLADLLEEVEFRGSTKQERLYRTIYGGVR